VVPEDRDARVAKHCLAARKRSVAVIDDYRHCQPYGPGELSGSRRPEARRRGSRRDASPGSG
jgi:hypothetical protein